MKRYFVVIDWDGSEAYFKGEGRAFAFAREIFKDQAYEKPVEVHSFSLRKMEHHDFRIALLNKTDFGSKSDVIQDRKLELRLDPMEDKCKDLHQSW